MTGAEHYERAEWLINVVDSVDDPADIAELLATAQVHAALAIAAATADCAKLADGYGYGR